MVTAGGSWSRQEAAGHVRRQLVTSRGRERNGIWSLSLVRFSLGPQPPEWCHHAQGVFSPPWLALETPRRHPEPHLLGFSKSSEVEREDEALRSPPWLLRLCLEPPCFQMLNARLQESCCSTSKASPIPRWCCVTLPPNCPWLANKHLGREAMK